MTKANKKTIIWCLVAVVIIAVVPVMMLKGAEFGGSDDAGSQMISEIDANYEPWFTPVLETAIGGELPGELESLLFCIQTGIGVGIIAFFLGRFVERKKYEKQNAPEKSEATSRAYNPQTVIK